MPDTFARQTSALRRSRYPVTPLITALALLCGACGGDSKKDVDEGVPVVLGKGGPGDGASYFPMQVGNTWTFDAVVSEQGDPPRSFRSTIRSTGTRMISGATATVFEETNADGFGSVDESALVSDGSGIAEFGSGAVAGIPAGVGAYWVVRFPLEPGSSFVQLDKSGIDVGEDLDGDGRNETMDVRSVVTVLGFESVSVPAGSFASCAKVQTRMDLSLMASGSRQRVSGTVNATEWHAPGVGWVKLAVDLTIDGEVVETDRLDLAAYDVNGVRGGVLVTGPQVTRIDASPSTVELGVSETASLSATAWVGTLPAPGAVLTWRSQDPAIAAVSASGVVTGLAPGRTTVYATANDVASNAVEVRVLPGRILRLATNDVVYDAARARIYASVPSRAGVNGNSVAVIEPVTGAVIAYLPAGSEPNALALSGDARYLYVGLDGAAKVTRFDLSAPGGPAKDLTFALGLDSFFGAMYAEDIEVMPGSPEVVAISRRYAGVSPRHAGVAIYDGGVARPTATPGHTGANVIAFSSGSRVYGLNNETTEFGFRRMTVDATGIAVELPVVPLGSGFGAEFELARGVAYTTMGAAVVAETGSLQGTFTGVSTGVAVEPDLANGVVFFLAQDGWTSGDGTLRTYDAETFVPLASLPVRVGPDRAADLVRWGSRGLAWRSADALTFVDDLPGVP